ncbi:GNAT family N-acetyltransferase [Nocardioides jensenii]|uniref:GNAT family N-acetyltransferase n=1 Tax=Nocardioides jensenii TaxID=1843 RepID=UPI001C3F44F0|nr:GNAT family N-acetyltransferase [Nocardioides jensenii]
MAHAGNYVAGAYAGKRLVAGSVGFFGAPADRSLHSHITGVAERARGRNVGYALKIHQRAWALSLGVDRVTWTFDPVIRRNAHFNLVKLGANPSEYFVNFYGDSDDVINAGQGSDRLLATWELASDHVHESLRSSTKTFRQPPPAMTVHAVRANGDVPVVIGSDQWGDASRVVVDTPRDIESLRGSDPSVALQWRMALRMVLADLIRDRATFLGLSSVGAYHFERNPR